MSADANIIDLDNLVANVVDKIESIGLHLSYKKQATAFEGDQIQVKFQRTGEELSCREHVYGHEALTITGITSSDLALQISREIEARMQDGRLKWASALCFDVELMTYKFASILQDSGFVKRGYNSVLSKILRFDSKAAVACAYDDAFVTRARLLAKLSLRGQARPFEKNLLSNCMKVDPELANHYNECVKRIGLLEGQALLFGMRLPDFYNS